MQGLAGSGSQVPVQLPFLCSQGLGLGFIVTGTSEPAFGHSFQVKLVCIEQDIKSSLSATAHSVFLGITKPESKPF